MSCLTEHCKAVPSASYMPQKKLFSVCSNRYPLLSPSIKTPSTFSPTTNQKPSFPFNLLHLHRFTILTKLVVPTLNLNFILEKNQKKLNTLHSICQRTQMPSDSGDQCRRPPKSHNPGAPPPEQEHLPCPRCDSTNTKFCYYNNYNFSQPRHFCKSCRRYWTHGGTLRDIPVGGGSRKNAKRSRTATSTGSVVTTGSLSDHHHHPLSATPVLVPMAANQGGSPLQFGGCSGGDVKPNVNALCSGTFTSLLNTQGPGFLALGGFGLGLGTGFEDMNFGIGRGIWPFPAAGDGHGGAGNGGGGTAIGSSWQFENGDGGLVGGDFCSWPDLAISTPGNGLK